MFNNDNFLYIQIEIHKIILYIYKISVLILFQFETSV